MFGNTIFDTILIDKIQFYVPLQLLGTNDVEELIYLFNNVFSKHYSPKAYNISKQYGSLIIKFTPTRYFQDYRGQENFYTDTNLSMPTENELFMLFSDLMLNKTFCKYITHFKISKIDLTKNIIVNYPISLYNRYLLKRIFKSRYHAIEHLTEANEKTVVITPLKRNLEKSDKTGHREIIFYDKVKELLNKSNTKIINLKHKLSKKEESMLPKGIYHKDSLSLVISPLNILRVEQQFELSRNISKISKYLELEKDNCLHLGDIISLLEKKQLYNKLDKFYTHNLKDIIFINEPTIENKELTGYDYVLSTYFEKIQELNLAGVCEDNGIEWKSHLKAVQNGDSKLYAELYQKLIIDSNL